jgi:ribonuclease HII
MQQTIEKPTASVNTKRDDKAYKKTGKLDDLLSSAVDETLKQVFKEAGAQVIYNFIENKCHLKRKEIAEKPEDFSADLKKLMVSAASMIEKMILENLYSKLELKFVEKEGYGFSDYLKELKEK